MKKIQTHYDNLGISRNAQPEVIKAAYKALAQKYHPDRNPNNPDAERIMQIINTAYQILIDPVRRAEHDRWINEQEAKIHTEQPTSHQNNHTQTHYDYAKNKVQQSTNNHRYDYTGQNSTQNQNNNKQHQNHYTTSTTHHTDNGTSFWSIHGRMRRTTYALLSIPTLFVWMIIRLGAESAVVGINNYVFGELLFLTIIELLPFYFLVFLSIKRLHDCNYKGWWILIPFVILAIFFTLPTKGTNRFGHNPRDKYLDNDFDGDFDGDFEKDYSFFGIIAISILINSAMISNVISQQNAHDNNTITNKYQKITQTTTQTSTKQSDSPVLPNNNQPTIDTAQLLKQAKADYKIAVADINKVWGQLHPSVQNYLQSEQIAFNKQREAHCEEQSLTINSDNNGREAYRYFCATQLLNERIEYLRTQINTVIYDPPNNIPSKDEFALSAMMNIYNNPKSAPPINLCQGDIYCNAFSALSQYWIDIPDDYRYQGGFNIKYQAQIGDGYGLNKGFVLNQEQSILLAERGNFAYYNSGSKSSAKEKIFAEGLAVLLYIEEMNDWCCN